jgi:hypothetical protein
MFDRVSGATNPPLCDFFAVAPVLHLGIGAVLP